VIFSYVFMTNEKYNSDKNTRGLIYIAEDDLYVSDFLKDVFNDFFQNYDTQIFNNGHKLQEKLEEHIKNAKRLDLVLTDNAVPDDSLGLKLVKEYSPKLKTPFLMMSAYDVRKEAIEAGARDFFLKPVKLLNFIQVVKNNLEKK